MEGKLKQFIEQKSQQSQAEIEAFAKATKKGENKKKVRELAADIQKRLEATPSATVPFAPAAPTSGAPAAASAVPGMGAPPAVDATPTASPR